MQRKIITKMKQRTEQKLYSKPFITMLAVEKLNEGSQRPQFSANNTNN